MNLLDIQRQRRRSFLATASGLASAAMLGEASAAGPADLIVDTHMHTWSGDPERFPFAHPYQDDFKPPEIAATVETLVEDMDQHGVQHCIIVQTIFHGWDNTYTVY
ncbi:MAG: hypothetical protein VB817_00855, partial [Pirellulaceae bacterium]